MKLETNNDIGLLNLKDKAVVDLIALALKEDKAAGDLTSRTVLDEKKAARAVIKAGRPGVLAGLPVAGAVFHAVDADLRISFLGREGMTLAAGDLVLQVEGTARSLLAAERTALNFLGRLSGVATRTAAFVDAVRGTKAVIYDTRKTTPGHRLLEKYAVHIGGGQNHRADLASQVLIKDNHIALAGGIAQAIAAARGAKAPGPVEVEVEALEELREAVDAGADIVLLDNMGPAMLEKAVQLTQDRAILEASGGVTLASVRQAAETGIDRISVGEITHSAPAIDFSMAVKPV